MPKTIEEKHRRSHSKRKYVADVTPQGTKLKSGEFVTRQADAEERHERLRKLSQELLSQYGPNWHRHGLATLKVEALSRVLYYNTLYQKIIDVPGVICEFGVHWGATLAELINLRSIYEPFNTGRVIYGFDTFEGFPSVDAKDGGFSNVGDYSTKKGHEEILDEVLQLHESFAPLSQMKKFSLIKGDASETVHDWLDANPHAIISMVIFDMDIYEPTKNVLKAILPRLTKGSVLVFDELNCGHFPGETRAVQEILGVNNLRLKKSPLQSYCSWAVWGE